MDNRFGAHFQLSQARDIVQTIVRAEELGVSSVWLTSPGPDPVTTVAVAGALTKIVRLGTAVVPTFPRHPLILAHQVEVIDAFAPGRFVLGIGPSHEHNVKGQWGIPFERPLEHLTEYVAVLRSALQGEKVDFAGKRIEAHAPPLNRTAVPIMISALRRASFRLAGQIADGGIPWICPARYLKEVALPALREGAAEANRPAPLMLAHAFIALSDNADQTLAAVREKMAIYPRSPFYRKMFAAAGFPEAEEGQWSNRMIDAVVIRGDEREVAAGLRSFLDESGGDEMIVSTLPVGPDEQEDIERGLRLLGSM